MRTAAQERARYNWLTPKAFAGAVGIVNADGEPMAERVREIIHDQSSEALQPPFVMDVSRSSQPRYMIRPDAVEVFIEESQERLMERVG